ncbi:hypothetical protein [Nitrobacter vulgaris]|uniref:Uncharacterized protein n=1 Tax=Nitrobacter vulgaris TaxID=29421 RepID=A0A1V4I291_NITVU|nr:hypothetical protein [Nitrobacter vulgaris]OPH84348.1 hypothetical protein B2M20_02295 [Nitrobacter vulgaris]
MSKRTAKITQAELERVFRAAKAQGLQIARIIARSDAYVIETDVSPEPTIAPAMAKRKPVL